VNAVKHIVEQLDPIFHERARLGIMSVLAAAESITFTDLRDTLGMTDGNLSIHLQRLEREGYVVIDKSFVKRRPQTTCSLSALGRERFKEYLHNLEAIIQQGRLRPGA